MTLVKVSNATADASVTAVTATVMIPSSVSKTCHFFSAEMCHVRSSQSAPCGSHTKLKKSAICVCSSHESFFFEQKFLLLVLHQRLLTDFRHL